MQDLDCIIIQLSEVEVCPHLTRGHTMSFISLIEVLYYSIYFYILKYGSSPKYSRVYSLMRLRHCIFSDF